MLETPQIVSTTNQLTAIIHVTVPRSEIQQVMGPGFGELFGTIGAQGIAPTGPPFCHHLKITPDTFDFQISVPVASPVTAAGRVRPSQWPAMKVARTVYQGAYEGLGAAWGEFDAWIAAQGLKAAPDLWEVYLSGPESSSDPATFRTQLNRPLVD